jgi:hypothetical protein
MDHPYIQTGRRGYHEAYRPDFKPRNKTLSLMASDDEAEQVDAAAKAAGLKRSAWLTKVVMAHVQKLRDEKAPAKKAATKAPKNTPKNGAWTQALLAGSATHGSLPDNEADSAPTRPTQPCVVCKATGKIRAQIKTAGRTKKFGDTECPQCGGLKWVYKLRD